MQTLNPQETLFVVARKRVVPLYEKGQSGARELSLLVGRQEITFDQPELFPWAEALIEKESFVAESATAWSAEPLEWPRVQGLLQSLLEAGLLARSPQLQAAPR